MDELIVIKDQVKWMEPGTQPRDGKSQLLVGPPRKSNSIRT